MQILTALVFLDLSIGLFYFILFYSCDLASFKELAVQYNQIRLKKLERY
jgi:hypothetical protein